MAILHGAARAPSGTNIQPWKVHVVTGAARERLSRAVLDAARLGRRSEEYAYMPSPLKEPYLSRRRNIGFELYRLYGIERNDLEARKHAMLRNFEFFGAPVGLFFAMERYLLEGSWLDCGMFMQNVMILAREYGWRLVPSRLGANMARLFTKNSVFLMITSCSPEWRSGSRILTHPRTHLRASEYHWKSFSSCTKYEY